MKSLTPLLNKAYALLVDQESQRNLASTLKLEAIEGMVMYSHKSSHLNHGTSSYM